MSSFLDDKGLNKFFQAIKAKFDTRYLNGPANSLIEQNKKSFLKVWRGTADEFKQVETKESDTAYLVEGESADTEYAPITHAARHSKDGADPIDPVSIGATPYVGSYNCASGTEIDAALDDMATKVGEGQTVYGNINVTDVASLLGGSWSIRVHAVNSSSVDVFATMIGMPGNPITIRTRTKYNGTWGDWKNLSDDLAIAAALEGKAPSGFGWGEELLRLVSTAAEVDAITANSVVRYANDLTNLVDGDIGSYTRYTIIVTYAVNATDKAQDVYCYGGEAHGDVMLHRGRFGNTWLPWEWINPPLTLGVEYRTTERYLGKPVYVKTVDTGALPNATYKEISASFPNANRILSVYGSAYQDAAHFILLPCLKYGADMYDADCAVQVTVNNSQSIIIATKRDMSRFTTSSVCVKYTKSTD